MEMNTGFSLIPPKGVHITEAEYPRGFHVAKYDEEGFTSAPRWFETLESAWAYARQLGKR
jgi:hypothetical protein